VNGFISCKKAFITAAEALGDSLRIIEPITV
jgi:hypothetical protein